MSENLHHTHLMASDIDASIDFFVKFFGAKVVLDQDMAGARNVFMKIGCGRLHFYEQPPQGDRRGQVHHLGIQTDDLEGLVWRLKEGGVKIPKPIQDFGSWKYVMAPAPDNMLLELFQVDMNNLLPGLEDYFCG